MWDPITIFAMGWMLNIGLPLATLSVEEVIQARENIVINQTIIEQASLRSGL